MKSGSWLVLTAVLFTGACAHTPDQYGMDRQREAREYRRLEWEHQFVDYQRRCYQAGGQMVIQASSRLPRSGIPRRGDYFNCTRGIKRITQH